MNKYLINVKTRFKFCGVFRIYDLYVSGPVEHIGTVGICPNKLLQKNGLLILAPFFAENTVVDRALLATTVMGHKIAQKKLH